VNALERQHKRLLSGGRKKSCGCHREKGKPVLIAGRYRCLVQHIPDGPRAMTFMVRVVGSGNGATLGVARTEKAAVAMANKAMRRGQ
jgi:hypothetical protein